MPDLKSTDPERPVLVLFRHDLRLADNAALHAAAQSRKPVIPAFIMETAGDRFRPIGGARRWWLHHSLDRLSAALSAAGVPLILRSGLQLSAVEALVAETGADAVLWNRRYDPAGIGADSELKAMLKAAGIHAASFAGHLLHEPWMLKTGSGGPFRVFTPFWRALDAGLAPASPLPAPAALRPASRFPASEPLDDWKLLPSNPDWAGGLRKTWTPGEAAAHERLSAFLQNRVPDYKDDRDLPGIEGTSRLSPHLAHGEITSGQIFAAIAKAGLREGDPGVATFRKEVGWREFSYHLLFHNPDLATRNFNPAFDDFPWSPSPGDLKRWQKGLTGYPLVDAGMRELWQTGWMHNRVRMVTASFLAKHLLTDWREGEAWFWDTLVDADPASNAASWQWVAGSGADAAPYFRVFNPVLQGEKFDPAGRYVRRFVPELVAMTDDLLHRPWDAPASGYPAPVVDHAWARDRALTAYKVMRGE